MRNIIKRILALLLILCMTLASVYALDRVLLIKRYDGVQPMQSLYAQKENTVDVLLMGNSHIGVHTDTATLWQDYGISAFALWGGVQPMWNTYYYLVEALKTQSPQAVVLEIGGLSYDDEYSDEATQLKNVAGMRLSLNKWAAVQDTAPKDRWVSLMLGLPLYHQRYSEITQEDFEYFPWSTELISNKGSYALYGHGDFDFTDPATITDVAEISQKELDYLYSIIGLCRNQGIKLILVKTPTVDVEKYQPYCNAVEQLAQEQGLDFYNFNLMYDETGIVSEDFYPDTHLNLSGARKVSRVLAQLLQSSLNLSDHRGDENYSSWDVNAEQVNDRYLLSITGAEDYIKELCQSDKTVLLIKNGDWENREPYLSFAKELSKLGIDEEQLLESGSAAWLVDNGSCSEKGNSFNINGKVFETDFDVSGGVKENGSLLFAFSDLGITLLVYDNSCGELLDRVDFLHTDSFSLSRK